jgi:hypothetical protein
MADKVQFFNPNDGVAGRDGGPYLDQVEAARAELVRAKIEGREPDLENPPAYAGIPLNTAAQQLALVGVNSLPSQEGRNHANAALSMRAQVDDEDNLLQAHSEVDSIAAAQTESVEGILPNGLMDTNPAAIGTGPFAGGFGESAHGPLVEVKDGNAVPRESPKKRATAAKKAAKKAVPSKVVSSAATGGNSVG